MAIRLTLGMKIAGGFALVMLGALSLGCTGVLAIVRIQHTQLVNNQIIEVRRTMYDARLAATRYMIKFDAKEADTSRAELAKVRAQCGDVLPELTADEAAMVTRLVALVDDYEQHLTGIVELVENARKSQGGDTSNIPGLGEQFAEWRAAGVSVVAQMGEATRPVYERMVQVGRLAMTTMIALVVGVMLFGLVLSWLITRAITTPVRAVRVALGSLAAGDLTRKTSVTNTDEVGAMATDLNRTIDSLHGIVGEITSGSHGIASSAEELHAISTELTGNAATVSRESESVAASATEVSQNISTFASGVEEMNASVVEISKNATQAATVAKQGVEASTLARKAMLSMGKSSAEIGEIVKLITSIAEQTNLLALNATIEAARAGDAGRGFAVVAGEVKELARKTAEATSDIRHRVEGIQSATSDADAAINQLSELSDQISALQQSIASAVEEQSATTRELAGNIAQVAQGGAEIAKNIVTVSEASKAARAGADETQTAAHELARLAQKLKDLVGRFKVA